MRITKKLTFIATLFALALSSAFANERYAYFDGNRSKNAYLRADYLADFNPGNDLRVILADSGARLVHQSGGARIWKLQNSSMIEDLRAGRIPTGLTGRFSQVFTSGRENGNFKALAGGVIVALKKGWSASEVQTWANTHGYTLQKKLPMAGNYYVVGGATGIASLYLANEIRQKQGVLWSSPNWWRQVQLK